MKGKVMAIVGGQFGSEGKGAVVQHIAHEYDVHVRVGGPNAGHTIYHEGRRWAMQSVPCGWINPNALLVLGAGALISPTILLREIDALEDAGYSILNRLHIDPNATILTEAHHREEGGTGGELHRRIGSTGEGVGAARLARIRRNGEEPLLASDILPECGLEDSLTDTVQLLNGSIDAGANILLEGTQGSGLSLVHGPWPYCTSADTNAGQLCADTGISPRRVTDVWLVVRTFPIRVAGNSGPLPGEITWEEVSRVAGRNVEERTTVTKKVRRVGRFDAATVRRAILLNDPSGIVVTFWDYLCPQTEGRSVLDEDAANLLYDWRRRYLDGRPIPLVGTGGPELAMVDLRTDPRFS